MLITRDERCSSIDLWGLGKNQEKLKSPKKTVISTAFRLLEVDKDHDKSAFYLPRQYLQKPDGGVCDEGFGEKSGAGEGV